MADVILKSFDVTTTYPQTTFIKSNHLLKIAPLSCGSISAEVACPLERKAGVKMKVRSRERIFRTKPKPILAFRSRCANTYSMSHVSSSSPTDIDIWEFVTCSKCHLAFSSDPSAPPQVPFWLTECGHVICNLHLSMWPSSYQRSSDKSTRICPRC